MKFVLKHSPQPLILKLLGMEEFFLNPINISTEKFTSSCSDKIKSISIEQWKMAISSDASNTENSNKLKFYSLFKTSFEMEPYLHNVKKFHMRKSISKFRCSDHKLEIEKGRHKNRNVDERICKICNTGIESEMHCLKMCPLYESLRNRLFKNFKNMNENDFINLLKCCDKEAAFKIGNFITKASKLREDSLLTLEKRSSA